VEEGVGRLGMGGVRGGSRAGVEGYDSSLALPYAMFSNTLRSNSVGSCSTYLTELKVAIRVLIIAVRVLIIAVRVLIVAVRVLIRTRAARGASAC
jgi:hypothetical protein